MSKRLLGLYNHRNFLQSYKNINKIQLGSRLLTDQKKEENSLKKVDENEQKLVQRYLKKIRFRKNEKDEEEEEERKGPFKNYFEDEERDKKSIMHYENFFDKNTKARDRENFMSAIEAFRLTNPAKNLYIDFIYGALLKMKEYNAHTHLEAYRKLMELFPIGPIRCLTKWQRDNMHYPRHQNCAIQILEQMERNGVLLDEDFARLTIKIFGDWTHVVRKAKRQLYWLPKFKNSNPYPLPSIQQMENMTDIEFAKAALERMCMSADNSIKVEVNFTDDVKDTEKNPESTWIVSAQSQKQIELLSEHKKNIPIFVDGPYFVWVRSKLVEYFLMKTDPLEETKEKLKKNQQIDEENFQDLYNMFEDPFKNEKKSNKKTEFSVHELPDGNIYAICCTGTGTKSSLYTWTKILEKKNSKLRDLLVVYRNKPKPSFLADMDKIKSDQNKNNEKTDKS